jgi:hypothetical protein
MLYFANFSNDIVKNMKKYPSDEDIDHINNCDGCSHCDYIMEHYGRCCCCDVIVNMQELYYDHPGGEHYCEDCVGGMPDNNTNDFVLCGLCVKRDVRENMAKHHDNFHNTWTCEECVNKSVVNNRFEILDL